MYLFSIRDKVADECGPPFLAANDAVALRNFKRVLTDALDEADYELYRLAEWTPGTGQIKLEKEKVLIPNLKVVNHGK